MTPVSPTGRRHLSPDYTFSATAVHTPGALLTPRRHQADLPLFALPQPRRQLTHVDAPAPQHLDSPGLRIPDDRREQIDTPGPCVAAPPGPLTRLFQRTSSDRRPALHPRSPRRPHRPPQHGLSRARGGAPTRLDLAVLLRGEAATVRPFGYSVAAETGLVLVV
ncbi:hypothetical protein ADL01_19135, partial [Streptomyces sp. NRRL WC-3618]